jgi:hypothetical protein
MLNWSVNLPVRNSRPDRTGPGRPVTVTGYNYEFHRSPFIAAHEIPLILKERELDSYVTSYPQKRLKRVYCTDLSESLFYNDLFHWTCFINKEEKSSDKQKAKAQQKLNIGHFFRLARVKEMTDRHESYLCRWIQFIENHPVKGKD